MSQLLTHTDLVSCFEGQHSVKGCYTYNAIEKALGIARQTLLNERSKGERGEGVLRPAFYVGRNPYFTLDVIFAFYVNYTNRNIRRAA